MKVIILTLLLAFATFPSAMADDPVSDTVLFVDGFLRGALGAEIGRVDECLKDGDSIVADVGKLITDVEDGFHLKILIKDLEQLMHDVSESTKDCEELQPTIIETFTDWEHKIEDPEEIGRIIANAIMNYGEQLEGDATGFLADWQDGKFETSGQQLGDIPHVLFDLCATVSTDPFDVGHFLDGFLSSALQSEITQVEDCLSDADALLDDIQKLITDVEAGFDLLPLISDLGALFTQIPESIKDCDDFKDDVDDVLKIWESEIKNPIVIAKIVYVALAQYQDRLKGDATGFVDEWKADHYEESGSKLGDIPHVLFDLCPNQANSISSIQALVKGN